MDFNPNLDVNKLSDNAVSRVVFSRDSDLTTANLVVDILFNVVDILCNVVDILKKLWIYYIFNG